MLRVNYIREKRIGNNLSVSELARRANISKGYLHSIEADTTTNIGIFTLLAICEALDCQLSELVPTRPIHVAVVEPLPFEVDDQLHPGH